MKDSYNPFTCQHRIATPSARNDGWQLNDRHCEPVGRGNPGHSSRCESAVLQKGAEENTKANKIAKNSIKAFSLIELLISLIIISLVAAAFVPIYTKKLAKTQMTVKIANAKKGLMIYTNPGTYAFDIPEGIDKIYLSGAGGGGGGAGANKTTKTKSFTSNSTFKIPAGVNAVTIKITGSGGGGGAANGAGTNKICKSYDWANWNSGLSVNAIPEAQILRGSEDGADLCFFKHAIDGRYPNWMSVQSFTINRTAGASQSTCLNENCCWYDPVNNSSMKATCTYAAAEYLCSYYPSPKSIATYNSSNPERGTYRLMSQWEAQYIANNLVSLYSTLNLCGNNSSSYVTSTKPFPSNLYCTVGYGVTLYNIDGGSYFQYHAKDGYLELNYLDKVLWGTGTKNTFQTRCVRPLLHFTPYSGAGGAGGAQLEKTFSVLPDDTLTIEIGLGGAGGVFGISKNNGLTARKGNGARGADTKLIHKRGSTTLGTYYVKGGFGGLGALTDAHGEEILASKTTPSGTCYANGSTNCTKASFSGLAGSESKGGNGAKSAEGSAAAGGYLLIDETRPFAKRYTEAELNAAKGQAATSAGFGGGGGFSPPWACEGSNCTQTAPLSLFTGGKGANGRIDITYDVIFPGGGGGAAAAAGEDYEIEYKITSPQRIVFTIGRGGEAAAIGQKGFDGKDTTVMEDEIILKGGKGGLLSGAGGEGGSLIIKNSVKSKVKVLNTDDILNPAKGKNGESGAKKDSIGKFINYGLDGGVGGGTFLGYFGGCGGGIITDTDELRLCATASLEDGVDAKSHNPVKNTFGGAGGGGGGATSSSSALGKGGAGADGFLRIRWGE